MRERKLRRLIPWAPAILIGTITDRLRSCGSGRLLRHAMLGASVCLLSCTPPVPLTRDTDARKASPVPADTGRRTLLAYVGAASKPPTEEAAELFERKTGIRVELIFGGSGYVLSQMRLAKQGDIYFPGSSDFMELAKRNGDVDASTEKVIVYLVPAINVQRGNPHNIRTLRDLLRPGIRVAIADPENVCVGAYAVEIVEREFAPSQIAAFRRNLVNYTASCEKTATAISLKMADAVIGWSVFEHWDPKRIETVPLRASQIPRIGYIPIAISKYTKQREIAQRFIDFISGPEGKRIFEKHHYMVTAEQAEESIGARKPIGGTYTVPAPWVER